MTTISTLATHVAAPVNVVLMRGLLSAAKRRFPYYNGVLPGELEMNQGSLSVKWRRINNLAAQTTALAERTGASAFGMGRSAVTPSISDFTVAVAKYGNHIIYNEELDLVNVNSRAAQLVDNLGENAGHSANLLMANVMDAITTTRFANGVASTAVVITRLEEADVDYAYTELNSNSAEKFFPVGTGSTKVDTKTIRESYFGICHTHVEYDVRAMTGFIGIEQYGSHMQTLTGEFGAYGGVRWCSTEIAPIATGGGTATATGMRGASDNANDVYTTMIYGRQAWGSVGFDKRFADEIYMGGEFPSPVELINKPIGSSGVADPYNEVGSIAWKLWFAARALNTAWAQKIESLATEL